ncbi:MAG TPA: Crp/Fnr family transcriptional regulator [Terriglobales bacterium]|nr:Crp/Fnr family transcriptional regulator [Terriglobales bacterium]
MASFSVSRPFAEKMSVGRPAVAVPVSPRVVPRSTRISCIQQAQLFRGLSLAECAEVASAAQERCFSRGQTIFREGDAMRSVLVLVAGRVKLTQLSRLGSEIIFRVGETGGVLDGLGLSANSVRRLTAVALGQCRVLAWDARSFAALEGRFPAVRRNAVAILAERLRALEERFLELATEQVAPRLARMLVRLLEPCVRGSQSINRVELSQEELAQMVGTTPFTISRLFSGWEKRGVLRTRREAVVILDPRGLIDLAESGNER